MRTSKERIKRTWDIDLMLQGMNQALAIDSWKEKLSVGKFAYTKVSDTVGT